jgi:urease accessory protein
MYAATSPSRLDPKSVPPTGDRDLQRVDGAVRVAVDQGPDGPVLRDLYQSSPCRALFPRIDGRDRAEVVFLNTAGGVAGGDRLRYALKAGAGAEVVATTQAAEKIYRAIDRCGRIETSLVAGAGAALNWLPQETIVFEGARLRRVTEVDAAGDARVLGLEWLVLGREAHGETLATCEIYDNWRVRRDGRLVWADSFRLTGNAGELIGRRALLADARATATLIYMAPDAAGLVDGLRDRLIGHPCLVGLGMVADLLVCRMLANSAAILRDGVTRLLRFLWHAIGQPDRSLPRVWAC